MQAKTRHDSCMRFFDFLIFFFLFFFLFFFPLKNLTLECIKTAVFDTRNPQSPYCGRGASPLPHPHPARLLRSLNARSIRSLAKLSSSFFKYFLSHPWWLLHHSTIVLSQVRPCYPGEMAAGQPDHRYQTHYCCQETSHTRWQVCNLHQVCTVTPSRITCQLPTTLP